MPATSANALAAHKDAFLSILPPFFVLGWRPIDRCKYIARHDYRRKRYSITAEAAFHPLPFVGIIQTRHQTPPGDLPPQTGSASCGERVWQYVEIWGGAKP